ncbi:hypothetical protein FOF48_15320 [Corallococcus sp. Z5C101001]|nr:hypothetical protein FOF48_15320 [Corallococcus sp. Z5C101001]
MVGIHASVSLKEQLLWGCTCEIVEGPRQALLEWAHRYDAHWLLERHDFLSPGQARRVPRPLPVAVKTGEGKAGLGAPGSDH